MGACADARGGSPLLDEIPDASDLEPAADTPTRVPGSGESASIAGKTCDSEDDACSLESLVEVQRGMISTLEANEALLEDLAASHKSIIASLEASVASLEATVASLEAIVDSQNRTIASLEETAALNDNTIALQRSTINSLESTLATNEATIETQSDTVATLESTAAIRDDTIATQQATVAKLQSNVATLRAKADALRSETTCGKGTTVSDGRCVPDCGRARHEGRSCEAFCGSLTASAGNGPAGWLSWVFTPSVIAIVAGTFFLFVLFEFYEYCSARWSNHLYLPMPDDDPIDPAADAADGEGEG